MGIMAAPTMTRAGYYVQDVGRDYHGLVARSDPIPPSVMLVVMGPVMGVSVAKLYASSFRPGFMLSGIFIAYVLIRSYLQPHARAGAAKGAAGDVVRLPCSRSS